MSDIRLDLLEKQMQVLQKEINSVLGEMQGTMNLLMQANARALQSLQAQIDKLEKQEKTE